MEIRRVDQCSDDPDTHAWEQIGENTAGDLFWCEKCGAIADGETDYFQNNAIIINSMRKPNGN